MGAGSWKCNSFVEIKLIFKDDLCWSIFNLEVPNPFSCLCLEFSSLTQTPLNLLFRTWWICGSSSPCNCAMWLMSWLARMSLHATAKGWKVQVAWACEKSNLMVDLMDWRDGVVGVICQEFQEKSPRSPVFCLMSSIAELQTLDKCLGSLQQPFLLMSLSSSSKTVGFLEETSWLSGMRWSKIQRKPPSDGFSLLLLPEASTRMDDGLKGFPSFFWKQNRPFRVFFSMAEPVYPQIAFIYGKSVSAMIHHESWEYHRMVLVFSIISIRNGLFSDFQDLESRNIKSQGMSSNRTPALGRWLTSFNLVDWPWIQKTNPVPVPNVFKWAVQWRIFFPSSGRIPNFYRLEDVAGSAFYFHSFPFISYLLQSTSLSLTSCFVGAVSLGIALTLGVSRAGGFFCEHSGSVKEKKQSAARREDLSVWWVSILHCGLVACKSTVNLWQHCNSWKDELAKAVCMSLKKTWPWGTEIHWCYKARGCQRYFWGHPSLWLQKMGWNWRHLRPHLDVWPTRRRWISDQVPLNQRGRIFWISSYNTFGSSNVELEGRKEQGRLLLGTHIGSSQA